MVPCIQWHGIASKALLMVTGKEMCGSNNLLSVLKWYSTIRQRSLRDPYPRRYPCSLGRKGECYLWTKVSTEMMKRLPVDWTCSYLAEGYC